MISRKTRTRAAATMGSVALLSGLALAGAPAAQAQEHSPQREAVMPFPLGGEHRMNFHAYSGCHWPEGKGNGGPTLQSIRADVRDLDQRQSTEASLTMDAFLPFNTVTIDWKNLETGKTGSSSGTSQGGAASAEVGDAGGFGDLEVTVTMTRSLLPSLGAGSVMPGAAQHSETFVLADQYDNCHSE